MNDSASTSGRFRRNTRPRGSAARFVGLVAVIGVFAVTFSPGPSASAATPAPRLWTDSGANTLRGNAPGYLVGYRDRYCPAGKPIPATLTLAQALANARTFVVGLAAQAAVNAFTRSSTATSAIQSRAAAVGMFADRKPVPALLALLRVHELQPTDPSILASIAALLNILGHPKEAYVISKAADAMKTTPLPAMGISGQATLLNNEGHALLGLRRWADAERVLRQAVTLAPELSEAKVNLAIALLCQQEDEDAVKFFRAGQYRRPYHMVDVSPYPPFDTAPVASEVFDLSHGVTGTLPAINIPSTWDKNNGQPAEAIWAGLMQEWVDHLHYYYALEQKLESEIDWLHMDPRAKRRFYQVVSAVYQVHSQPQIKPLYDKVDQIRDEIQHFLGTYFSGGNPPTGTLWDLMQARNTWPECSGGTIEACNARWQRECSTMNASQHAIWLPLMQAYDQANRRLFAASYRFQSAVVANLADPKLHQLAMVYVKEDWTEYEQILVRLNAWAVALRWSNCPAEPPTENPKTDDGSLKNPTACAPELKGVKLSVKLGDFVKFSANCEQIGFEVATKSDILWVGLFAEGSFNFVNGSGTIFAGVKAGGKIPETQTGVSAKEGFYLTVGSSGIKDIGMRVTTTGAFGAASGPIVEMRGPGYQISWASQTITFL